MKALFFSQDGDKVEQLGLALRLRWPDLRPLIASEGRVGLEVIEREEPDISIICENLSDLTVWETIKEIRLFSDVPIIVALESQGEMDVVKALEHGADDFIRLPCNLTEFMARAVALLRRVGLTKQRSNESPIRCGDLLINPATYEVYLGDSRLVLTPTEFKLLYLLAKNRHVTLTQEFIQRVIWSEEIEAGEALKKYIQRLRKKLGDDARNPIWIKTVHGVGYRFAASTSPAA